jgi:hypothetical protein
MSIKIPMKDRYGNIVEYTFISPEDYDKVSQYNWCIRVIGKTKYAQQTINRKLITLHRFLLGNSPEGMIIQHIDGNGLNNVRENIKFATLSQKAQCRKKKDNSSRNYIGVHWDKTHSIWRVSASGFTLKGNTDEVEAAKTYDTFVLLYHGKDAQTNNLVTFDEIKHIDIETLKSPKPPRELPKYISHGFNGFLVRITYKKKDYIKNTKTIEEAQEVLKDFQQQIEEIKKKEIEEHYSMPIIRNEIGDAIIPIKNQDGVIIDNVLVNDDMWHKCMQYAWTKNDKYYNGSVNGKLTKIHRFIMNAKPGDIVDHIDKNPQNNKTCNLRFSTATKNAHNKTKSQNASTSYMGVSIHNKNYRARITKQGKTYQLGDFKTEIEAAKAYNEKAKELYGEYANLNIIPEETS